MWYNPAMSDIPTHILQQVHQLAADGLPIEQISFMMRLSPSVIEEELRRPTMQVNTTA